MSIERSPNLKISTHLFHREWATNLADNTQDVAAVVNGIEVVSRGIAMPVFLGSP